LNKKVLFSHTFAVCAHGENEYLDKCVESVINQELSSNVIICTSTDNNHIRDVAKKYNVELFVNEIKTDMQGSWNFALKCAKTQFVTICHQDDYYDSKYYLKISKKFKSDVVFLYTGFYDVIDGKKTVNFLNRLKAFFSFFMRWRFFQAKRFFKRKAFSFGNSACCPSCCYNKGKTGIELFHSNLKNACDWDTFVNLCNVKGRIVFKKKRLTYKRIHKQSATFQDIMSGLRYEEDKVMFDKLWNKFFAKFFIKIYKSAYKYNAEK